MSDNPKEGRTRLTGMGSHLRAILGCTASGELRVIQEFLYKGEQPVGMVGHRSTSVAMARMLSEPRRLWFSHIARHTRCMSRMLDLPPKQK